MKKNLLILLIGLMIIIPATLLSTSVTPSHRKVFLIQSVSSFTLVNAATGQDIQIIGDNATINLATLPGRSLNIRANTSPSAVGSVVFNLSGTQTRSQTESAAPYALFGDNNGTYNAWTPAVGTYSLNATPYTSAGGAGTPGTPLTINFRVVDSPVPTNTAPVARAGSAQTITLPTNTATLDGSGSSDADGSVAGYSWSETSGPGTALFSPGPTVQKPTVNGLVAGTYVFSLVVTDNAGAVSKPASVTVTVNSAPVGQSVSSCTLINATNNQEIQTINNNATLNLATLPARNLNIRANTSPATVGSVAFNLSGTQSRTQTETTAPYALFGDNNGTYNSWTPATGNYTLAATPYTGASVSGTAGAPLTINFRVIDSAAVAVTGTYYVSPAGNDNNNGTTSSTPWQTLSKVSSFSFQNTDKVLLQGLQTFSGTLSFTSGKSPGMISTYGLGRATIRSGTGNGLYAYNVGNLEVHNLIVVGAGVGTNSNTGIFFLIDKSSSIPNILVDNCDVSGFSDYGIYLKARNTNFGYSNVRITNNAVHGNGQAGISSEGNGDIYNHSNFYVAYDTVYNNAGRTDITTTHTGDGIVLGGLNGFTIEHCIAYENGASNRNTGGGPVGIWCWNAKNGVIQYSESHHNHAGLQADGGGFDIDGGSQNCVLQYNYSHDNEGSGFSLFEYGSTNQFQYDTIRYNISENDGLKNGYGSFSMWANASNNKVSNCQVYNNVFYASNAAGGETINIVNNYINNVVVFNTIFYGAGVPIFKGDPSAVTWQKNDYYSTGTSNFTTGGVTVNPLLVSAGSGRNGYKLQSGSPLIDAGSFNNTFKDFYGGNVPQGKACDIGVYETPSTGTTSAARSMTAEKFAFAGNAFSAEQLIIQPTYKTLKAYPNPGNAGSYTISFPRQLEGEMLYTLVSLAGKKLKAGKLLLEKPASSLQFDFSAEMVASGVYYLSLEGKELKGQVKLMHLK